MNITRKLNWMVLAAVALVLVLPVAAVAAADGAASEKAPNFDDQMAAMMAAGKPGPHHEHLAARVGKWQAKVRSYLPGAEEPVESRGIATNTMILDGRYLEMDYTGEFMRQKLVGFGLEGYDNASGKHTGLWVDNFGTAMMTFSGECSEDGNVVTMTSENVDAETGEPVVMKGVTTIRSTTMHTYEAWEKRGDGEFVKTMEIIYTKL